MWASWFEGMTSTGPIVAMGIFMVVFTLAVARSIRGKPGDSEIAALPLHDSINETTTSPTSSDLSPLAEVKHV